MTEYFISHESGDQYPVRNIYCVGRNYAGHARELGNPLLKEPVFFQKGLTCLTTEDRIKLPSDRTIQHEIELVILISRPGERIAAENAMDYLGGFALGLDLTDRTLQKELKERKLPWFLAKSFKNSAVVSTFFQPDMGNWTETFWLKINGNVVQKGQMDDMVFDIPFLIEFLSSRLPLLEGDIVFTGTPEGVGTVEKGDVLELGLGESVLKTIRFR